MEFLTIMTALSAIYLLTDSGIRNNHQVKNLLALFLVGITSYYVSSLFPFPINEMGFRIIFVVITAVLFFIIGIKSEGWFKRSQTQRVSMGGE